MTAAVWGTRLGPLRSLLDSQSQPGLSCFLLPNTLGWFQSKRTENSVPGGYSVPVTQWSNDRTGTFPFSFTALSPALKRAPGTKSGSISIRRREHLLDCNCDDSLQTFSD